MNDHGWAATSRGRKELAVVGLFCLAFAVVPLATTELYPFSRAPMFADAPELYCDYSIVTPDGQRFTESKDLVTFAVQRNYWGNPLGVGVGFEPAQSVDDFGRIAEKDAVVQEVGRRLAKFPYLKYVEVEQRIIGPIDADHIGVQRMENWRVDNSNFGSVQTSLNHGP